MINKAILLSILITLSFAQETYVLIHGATVGAWYWFKIKARLEEKGHNVIALDLPSSGVDKTDVLSIQLQDHVDAVLSILDSLSEPAIVVGHSYGGVIVSLVSEARPEKIKKAVFCDSFMLQNGDIPMSALQQDTDSLIAPNLIPTFDSNGKPLTLSLKQEAMKELFCEDCCDQDLILLRLLSVPHPASTLMTPITLGAGFDSVKKVYISALEDKALTPGFQEDMYSKFPEIEVYKIRSSHLPMLSKPQKLTKILLKIAKN